ncbi:MAG: hypothetical protein AB1589_41615 [Cyanobacteriota bacterium]
MAIIIRMPKLRAKFKITAFGTDTHCQQHFMTFAQMPKYQKAFSMLVASERGKLSE